MKKNAWQNSNSNSKTVLVNDSSVREEEFQGQLESTVWFTFHSTRQSMFEQDLEKGSNEAEWTGKAQISTGESPAAGKVCKAVQAPGLTEGSTHKGVN